MIEPIQIFISSVQKEFKAERLQICNYIRTDALLRRFFVPFIFEELPATNVSAEKAYLNEVTKSKIYLGLLGQEYGFEDAEGKSPTEKEYDTATENNIHRIVLIKSVTKRNVKEEAFTKKVQSDVIRRTFSSYDELRTALYAALVRYLEENEYLRFLPWDASVCQDATVNDIDEEKVADFLSVARKRRNYALPEGTSTAATLRHLNLLDSKERFTNAAIMLFGKNPQRFHITSEVKCMQFYGNIVEKPVPAYQIYKGDVFQLVDQATSFVMSRIDNWIGTHNQVENASAPSKPELPIEAVREAICNAVVHRQYTSNGSVQIMLFRNRLEIWNPGCLPDGLSIKQLSEPHQSLPQNPLIAEPMFLKGYIEKAGTGTEDIINKCISYGLAAPEFSQGTVFKTILWRNEMSHKTDEVVQKNAEVVQKNAEVVQKIIEVDQKINILSSLVIDETKRLSAQTVKDILYAINNNAYISVKELMSFTGKGSTTIKRYLSVLTDKGIILHVGPDKGGYRKINWEKAK